MITTKQFLHTFHNTDFLVNETARRLRFLSIVHTILYTVQHQGELVSYDASKNDPQKYILFTACHEGQKISYFAVILSPHYLIACYLNTKVGV